MDCKVDGIGGDVEITALIKEKTMNHFVSTWKILLYFWEENERNEIIKSKTKNGMW